MKKIKIKRANWKSTELLFDKPINITTLVIKQGKLYVDPTDGDFLGALYKIYVRKYSKKSLVLTLSAVDIFYYEDNHNVYLLNAIYNNMFPNKKQNPFNPILESKSGEKINIGLFNFEHKQIKYLIDIIKVLKVDLKYILKNYTVLDFPKSLDSYDNEKLYDFKYSKIDKKKQRKTNDSK